MVEKLYELGLVGTFTGGGQKGIYKLILRFNSSGDFHTLGVGSPGRFGLDFFAMLLLMSEVRRFLAMIRSADEESRDLRGRG